MAALDLKDMAPADSDGIAESVAQVLKAAEAKGVSADSALKNTFQTQLSSEEALKVSGLEDPDLVAHIRDARSRLAQQTKQDAPDAKFESAEALRLMSKTMRFLSDVKAEASAAAELVFTDAANTRVIAAFIGGDEEQTAPYGFPPLEDPHKCLHHLATKIEGHADAVQKVYTSLGVLTALAEQWRRACQRLADLPAAGPPPPAAGPPPPAAASAAVAAAAPPGGLQLPAKLRGKMGKPK